MMLAVTIGIAFAMAFRPRNVMAMAAALHIIRNNDQTLARALAASLAKTGAHGHPNADEEASLEG